MKKVELVEFIIGMTVLVVGLGIFRASRTEVQSGTPTPMAQQGGTPTAASPLASNTPKAEAPPVESALAAKIQKLSPPELETRMKEIDSEYFTETMRDRLNRGEVSPEERARAKAAFEEKNALFARWAEIKIAKYDAAIKRIESHHAANVERAKGEMNETN